MNWRKKETIPKNASTRIWIMWIASWWCQNRFTLGWPCRITPNLLVATMQLQRWQFHIGYTATFFPEFFCGRCINLKEMKRDNLVKMCQFYERKYLENDWNVQITFNCKRNDWKTSLLTLFHLISKSLNQSSFGNNGNSHLWRWIRQRLFSSTNWNGINSAENAAW